ncbi:hypothetical protein [Nocardia transvalensis]|uniref:hypothetical protein n=1 Tax=Nocardia transvalensis TaxID=37333 RepID=UPI001892FF89|nr:hypothetical protein [Nocardia transvalensis]MBF6327400.1 hypothetical protein [Nocardia transvalensis]
MIDTAAVRQFGSVARQAFRELDTAAGATVEGIAAVAELIPDSATVPVWCETACALANFVQHSGDWFDGLAEYAESAVTACLRSDRAAADSLGRVAVLI